MKKGAINSVLFKDSIVPVPGVKGNWGGMGNPLSEGPKETKGELPGVQFTKLEGEGGAKINIAGSAKK